MEALTKVILWGREDVISRGVEILVPAPWFKIFMPKISR